MHKCKVKIIDIGINFQEYLNQKKETPVLSAQVSKEKKNMYDPLKPSWCLIKQRKQTAEELLGLKNSHELLSR